jgi:hypothetical protein
MRRAVGSKRKSPEEHLDTWRKYYCDMADAASERAHDKEQGHEYHNLAHQPGWDLYAPDGERPSLCEMEDIDPEVALERYGEVFQDAIALFKQDCCVLRYVGPDIYKTHFHTEYALDRFEKHVLGRPVQGENPSTIQLPDLGVVVPDSKVPKQLINRGHALIEWNGDRECFEITDAQSVNGVMLKRRGGKYFFRISYAKLREGDTISLGDARGLKVGEEHEQRVEGDPVHAYKFRFEHR